MNLTFVAMGEKVATWRTLWPARELRRRGYRVQVYGAAQSQPPRFELEGETTYVFHMVNRAWKAEDTGRIITLLDILHWARGAGRLVLSVDDDWTKMLHIQEGAIDDLTRAVHASIPELVRTADSVIVATEPLAEVYGKWAREIHVVPNAVPEWVLQLPKPDPVERITWMGEMYVHGRDWNMLQPFARDLPPLYLVGTGQKSADVVRGWGADVETCEAILDQRKLYREMGRGVGAIIPLEDTPFNRGKSWSKALEFAARGVPTVASRHTEYERLQELTGTPAAVCDTPEALVEAAQDLWQNRRDGSDLPGRVRAAGLTMETGGGDAWEKALA